MPYAEEKMGGVARSELAPICDRDVRHRAQDAGQSFGTDEEHLVLPHVQRQVRRVVVWLGAGHQRVRDGFPEELGELGKQFREIIQMLSVGDALGRSV